MVLSLRGGSQATNIMDTLGNRRSNRDRLQSLEENTKKMAYILDSMKTTMAELQMALNHNSRAMEENRRAMEDMRRETDHNMEWLERQWIEANIPHNGIHGGQHPQGN